MLNYLITKVGGTNSDHCAYAGVDKIRIRAKAYVSYCHNSRLQLGLLGYQIIDLEYWMRYEWRNVKPSMQAVVPTWRSRGNGQDESNIIWIQTGYLLITNLISYHCTNLHDLSSRDCHWLVLHVDKEQIKSCWNCLRELAENNPRNIKNVHLPQMLQAYSPMS
jgi:hypothetical protein